MQDCNKKLETFPHIPHTHFFFISRKFRKKLLSIISNYWADTLGTSQLNRLWNQIPRAMLLCKKFLKNFKNKLDGLAVTIIFLVSHSHLLIFSCHLLCSCKKTTVRHSTKKRLKFRFSYPQFVLFEVVMFASARVAPSLTSGFSLLRRLINGGIPSAKEQNTCISNVLAYIFRIISECVAFPV